MNSPFPKRYDPDNARQLVGFAADAYRDNGQSLIVSSSKTDTRAVISELSTPNSPLSTDLVIAFRGTRSLTNFVTDVRCQRVPLFPGAAAEVHEGFKQALDSIWPELDDVICSHLSRHSRLGDGGRLWFTGHSLGAALAKLAALRFSSAFTNVYTFGEPRVGNAAFRDLYNSQLGDRTFRVVDGEDFITRIPWLLGAYRHSGTEVFYDCLGRPHVNPHWWMKGPSDVIGTWEEWERDGRIALLADHHVRRYQELFSALNPNLNLNPNLPSLSASNAEIKITSKIKIAPSSQ